MPKESQDGGAPERIWHGPRGFWTFPKEGAVEYVRADLGDTGAATGASEGEKLYMALARSVIRRILEADANCDPSHDILLRLEAIIRERDRLKREALPLGGMKGRNNGDI